MSKPRAVIVCLMVAALTLAGTVVATPALADSLDVTCVGTESRLYSPGLLLSARQTDVNLDGVLFACESTDAGVTGGTYGVDYTVSLSCLALETEGDNQTRVFTWSDSSTSMMVATRTVARLTVVTVVTFTGTITAGKFAGDTAVQVVTGPESVGAQLPVRAGRHEHTWSVGPRDHIGVTARPIGPRLTADTARTRSSGRR